MYLLLKLCPVHLHGLTPYKGVLVGFGFYFSDGYDEAEHNRYGCYFIVAMILK